MFGLRLHQRCVRENGMVGEKSDNAYWTSVVRQNIGGNIPK